ncbi:hypothetical protein [Spirillospora sp. CA-294931]|uniref:hypothetical protein n=1 Tax=Spirillospora sp. CA-294931 TaxID=3240042 RepID=UPI003D9196B7
MATFGEILAAADAHLAQIVECLQQPELTEAARWPATTTELARLTRVLTRYADQIATGFAVPSAPGTDERAAARDVAALLREAEERFGSPESTQAIGPPPASHLRAASTLLGCGLDLLGSHITTEIANNEGHDQRGNAAVIAAADTARWLLHTVGRHATAAGNLAMRAGPETRPAGRSLLNAGATARRFGQSSGTPAKVIELKNVPGRIPPIPGEDRQQAIRGIGVSAERIQADDDIGSITTWRYLAFSAAIAHDISAHLARQLAHRLRELDHEHGAAALFHANHRIRGDRKRWMTLARRWIAVVNAPLNPNSELVVDAGDLVLRLGRLLYSAPDWAPTASASLRVFPTAQLAPGTEDVAHLGIAVLKALEACSTLADRHRRAVNEVAVLKKLRGPSAPAPDGAPQASDIREFLKRYERLQLSSRVTIGRLSQALTTLPPPSHLADEIALIQRRNLSPSPAAATLDFPTPIHQALQTPTSAIPYPNNAAEPAVKRRAPR